MTTLLGETSQSIVAGIGWDTRFGGKDMPQEKRPWYDSAWSWWASAALALVMVAEYTRLVLTADDSPRKVIALTIWVVLLILWLGRAIYRTWIKKEK
jgi:hypothetical protein